MPVVDGINPPRPGSLYPFTMNDENVLVLWATRGSPTSCLTNFMRPVQPVHKTAAGLPPRGHGRDLNRVRGGFRWPRQEVM